MTKPPTPLRLVRPSDNSDTLRLITDCVASIRTLTHATRHELGGLGSPLDVATLVGSLAALAEHLPQLLGQIEEWVETEMAPGQVLTDAQPFGNVTTALTAMADLSNAGIEAEALGRFLHDARHALNELHHP